MTTEKFESLCYIQTSFLPSDLITVKLIIENAIQYTIVGRLRLSKWAFNYRLFICFG